VTFEELMIRALMLCVELNELRKKINATAVLGEEPSQDLLERWAAVQKEMQKLTNK
jgi:hypothetical protein